MSRWREGSSSKSFQKTSCLTFLVLLLTLLVGKVDGFAAWMRCGVDLDPEEVVMNYFIKPAEEEEGDDDDDESSTKPTIRLAAYELGTGNEIQPNSLRFGNDNDDDDDEKNSVKTISIRIQIPNEMQLPPRSRFEFIVEVKGEASFVEPDGSNSMCDGRRAHSQNRFDSMILQIKRPVTTTSSTNTEEASVIELWAGWATEHEAVTLTPRLTIQVLTTNNSQENTSTPNSEL
eukprot:scaffold89757_cov39-Attheya_sp.AAC.2